MPTLPPMYGMEGLLPTFDHLGLIASLTPHTRKTPTGSLPKRESMWKVTSCLHPSPPPHPIMQGDFSYFKNR